MPGSGKSTWAKEFCEKNTNFVRINRDDLRNMRGQYWLPRDEDLITKWEFALVTDALYTRKSVVLDSTNFNDKHIRALKTHCESFISLGEVEFEEKPRQKEGTRYN